MVGLLRDSPRALTVTAIAFGAIGLYATWAGIDIARNGDTVPAFVGRTQDMAMVGLTLLGKWVIDFLRDEKGLKRTDDAGVPTVGPSR